MLQVPVVMGEKDLTRPCAEIDDKIFHDPLLTWCRKAGTIIKNMIKGKGHESLPAGRDSCFLLPE
jgi:hypothetical protein